MIEYDYVFERNIGEGKTQRFVPNQIPKKIDNLVLIEGKNSSGKSTLLNLIALGLYGNKNTKINPALQTKLNSLLDSNHQKIKYSFTITSEIDNTIIQSEKVDLNSNELIVKESTDGKTFKPISYENFEKKYNLIYDIPNNPTERLPELLKEFRDEQHYMGDRVNEFNHYLNDTIIKITSSRDTKRLEEIKKRLSEINILKKKLVDYIPQQELFLDSLERRAYINYLSFYEREEVKLTNIRDELAIEVTGYEIEGKKIVSRITRDKTKIVRLKSHFADEFNKLTPLIEDMLSKTDKQRFKIWKNIKSYDPEISDLVSARFEANYYVEKFSREAEMMRKDPSLQEATTWESVFKSLRQFEDSGLLIPQFKVTIGELVKLLKDESQKSSVLLQKYRVLTQLNQDLGSLSRVITEIEDAHKQSDFEPAEKLSESVSEDISGKRNQAKRI